MRRILPYVLIAVLCAAALSACSPSSPSIVGVQSPVEDYETAEGVNEAVGFELPVLPGDYRPKSFAVISDTIAQIEYGLADKSTAVTFRMEESTDDISGIYGVEYVQETINGIPVNAGTYEDIQVAWFTDGAYAYSLTATDMNGADFMTLVNAVTSMVTADV